MKSKIPTFCLFYLFLCMIVMPNKVFAQINYFDYINEQDASNRIITIMPFLRINPNGRSGGLGEAGIAISPSAGAMYHNASKLAFIEKDIGFEVTHSPWLRGLAKDSHLNYLSAYKRMDTIQTIGFSFRYFYIRSFSFLIEPEPLSRPRQWAADLAYTRKLSSKMSIGVTLKYALSHLFRGKGISGGKAAKTKAIDLSLYYQNPNATFLSKDATFSWGLSISNIGNKAFYINERKDFIPINLGIGTAIDMQMDEHNSLMFTFDINKLMVPTPDPEDETQAHREKALFSGVFGSFGDAPGGLSEELQELMFSIGAEYWYNDRFALRLGHFNEHKLKGNRKYITAGIGLKYSVFGLNFSYIIPAGSQPSPLDNTLRFQLNFDFGEEG